MLPYDFRRNILKHKPTKLLALKKNEMTAMLILMLAFILPGFSAMAQESKTEPVKVDLYYFYATKRCPTCKAIERETIKTIERSFAEQYKNGSLKLHILNLDDDANKKLVNKYEIYGSSLILVPANGGEVVNLTNTAFMYALDQSFAFRRELKSKLNEMLK